MLLDSILLEAPAKINLGLEVLRRRDDGFHDINTVFAAVGVYDDIRVAVRTDAEITLSVEGDPSVAAGPENLCVHAAARLAAALGTPAGFDIHLRKRIPVGAGLGGGSSDAAAVLLGASRLLGVDPNSAVVRAVAAGLGSDVPFFLQGGIAHATGRGEVLQPLHTSLPFTILLVKPAVSVSTPWAYERLGRSGERAASDLPDVLQRAAGDPAALRAELVNDFQEVVASDLPEIAALLHDLYASGASCAMLSGSGSALFGLFERPEQADAAMTRFGGMWAATCDIVPGIRMRENAE